MTGWRLGWLVVPEHLDKVQSPAVGCDPSLTFSVPAPVLLLPVCAAVRRSMRSTRI